MADFIIRNVDEAAWDEVKARADAEGRPLRWVFLRLIDFYRTHGMTTLERLDVQQRNRMAAKQQKKKKEAR